MVLASAPLGGGNKKKLPSEPLIGASEETSVMHDMEEAEILADMRRKTSGENKVSDEYYEITSDDLMDTPADFYAQFDGKVVSTIGYVQEKLQDDGQAEMVAKARMHRGEDLERAKPLVHNLAIQYILNKNLATGKNAEVLTSLVVNEVCGLGPIEPLWQNPFITEIMVNGSQKVRIETGGKLHTVKGARFRDEEHLLETCRQILANLGRTIDVAHPYEDGRLPDGSRINVTHPTIGNLKSYLTIRRFREEAFSMEDLVNFGSLTPELAEFLGTMVWNGMSTVVVGPTGSGKTTLLNALSGCIPETERVITIEDNIEMTFNPKKDVIALEARKAAQGEKGAVTIRDLVKNTLRMRPDRIVVGEVRDGSAYDMLQAMNTGHDGSMTTVHANDPWGAIDRLVNLISEVGEVDSNRALSLVAGGVDMIVSIERFEDGTRKLSSIAEVPGRVQMSAGTAILEPIILWEYVQTGVDENGKVVGGYEKRNDLSKDIIRRKRLDNKEKLTLQQVYDISKHAE